MVAGDNLKKKERIKKKIMMTWVICFLELSFNQSKIFDSSWLSLTRVGK